MVDMVLWAGTLGSASFDERLGAAAAAGMTAMSVFPWDCRGPAETGSMAVQLRERADAKGVRIVAVDPVSTWLPGLRLDSPKGRSTPESAVRARFAELFDAYSVDECLVMASDLGADLISLIEAHGFGVDLDSAGEAFGRVCDRASERGLRVQLEFMPFSGVPDLRAAWDIVRRAGRGNGGLVLDSWHYFRSTPDHELLASLPPDAVFSVQLSDGPARPEPDLWTAAAQERLLPGAGDFDLATMLEIVVRTQPGATFGPEVVSSQLATLEAEQAARLSADAAAAVVRRATHGT